MNTYKYLIKLLPLYKKMGREEYILSKLFYYPEARYIVCANCRHLLVSSYTCKTSFTNDIFSICCLVCKNITNKNCKTVEEEDSVDFEDLLIM